MTAREKFYKDQKVIMTDKAIKQNIVWDHRKRKGRVVGFCWSPLSVRIKIDGRKTVSSYHVDFWEAV